MKSDGRLSDRVCWELRRLFRAARIVSSIGFAVAMVFGLLFSVPGGAAVIRVDAGCELSDAIDRAQGSVVAGCNLEGEGPISIVLAGDVVLTDVDNETDGPNGLPSITARLEILGQGFEISRSEDAPPFRILHVAPFGALRLADVTLSGGWLPDVDEVSGAGVFSRGRLTLSNSTLTRNLQEGSLDGAGALGNEGAASIVDCVFSDNLGIGAGGVVLGEGATMDVLRTQFIENLGFVSGAVYNKGFLRIDNGEFVKNETDGQLYGGGGVLNTGNLLVDRTTFTENDAFGGDGGGILNLAPGVVTMTNSTVAGSVWGGGVSNTGEFHVSNSTFSGNRAPGFTYDSHGFNNIDGLATITNCTFWDNWYGIRQGGGFDAQSTTIVTGSILGGSGIANCDDGVNTIINGGGNLDDDATCPRVAVLSGLFGVLEDNGGATQTHRLLFDSSAIDRGVPRLMRDQRGFERSNASDAGAYEFEATPPPTFSFFFSGDCPGAQSMTITSATPQSLVSVARGIGGLSEVPSGQCAGTLLRLFEPELFRQFQTDEEGRATFEFEASEDSCGELFQAIDLGTCGTSAVEVVR